MPHGKLSRAVRAELKAHGGKPHEYRFVAPAASDKLLEKIAIKKQWSKEKLGQAKKIEAHSTRLIEARNFVGRGKPISTRSAREIIKKAVEQIPDFVKRNSRRLTVEQKKRLQMLLKNLKKDLVRLQGVPDELPNTLHREFLIAASQFNKDAFENLAGKTASDLYRNAIRRTYKILATKSKK